MTALNQNRYDQLLRRVGDLKGPGSKVSDALTELFPMLDVENIAAELLVLSGSRLCMGTITLVAGGVGFFSTAFLRVNGGAGIVARVIDVYHVPETSQIINIGPTQNSSADTGVEAYSDGRVFGQGTVAKVQGNNNFLSAGSAFYRPRSRDSIGFRLENYRGFAVVTPGTALSVSNTVDNLGMDVSFMWIERQAQPSELNL